MEIVTEKSQELNELYKKSEEAFNQVSLKLETHLIPFVFDRKNILKQSILEKKHLKN